MGVLTVFGLLFLILNYDLDLCKLPFWIVIISGLLINPTISPYDIDVHLCVCTALILGMDGLALLCLFSASLPS